MRPEETTGVMQETSAALVASNSMYTVSDTAISTPSLIPRIWNEHDDYLDALLHTPASIATNFRAENLTASEVLARSTHTSPTGRGSVLMRPEDLMTLLNSIPEDLSMATPKWAQPIFAEQRCEYDKKRAKARDRLENRMRVWGHSYSHYRMPYPAFGQTAALRVLWLQRKRQMKKIGKRIAMLIATAEGFQKRGDRRAYDSCNAVANVVNAIQPDLLPSFMSRMYLWNKIAVHDIHRNNPLFESYQCCDDCGHVAYEDYVARTNDSRLLCENCYSSARYVYSSMQNVYIRRANAFQYYGDQEAFDSESCDYITREFARSCGYRWDDNSDAFLNDDVDTDVVDEPPDGLRDYHHSRRRFFIHQQNPNTIYRAMPPLGLELELWAPDRGYTVSDFRNNFTMIGDLLMERDGSLDGIHGMELITDPLGYNEWFDIGPKLCKQALATNCVAYNHPDTNNNYGIHITLDRAFLSSLQEARLFLFMAANENLEFIRAVAQRNGIYGPAVDIGRWQDHDQKVKYLGGIDRRNQYGVGKKILGRGKYAPINFKGHLAEIRIFQSTLHTESFMKNLEFVWAIVEWVKDTTGSKWRHTDFVKWFAKRGNARKDYPNLWVYLQRPAYRVKNYGYSIQNSWASLFPAMPNPVKGTAPVVLTAADDSNILLKAA